MVNSSFHMASGACCRKSCLLRGIFISILYCISSFPYQNTLQFSLVAQLCPTLCDPMNCSTPGLPVHHQLPEFTQTHVHRVSDAIQPSHPLSSPSPPAPNPSQHQSLFQRVNYSHEVAKVLEFQLQHQSFQRNPRADLLQNGLVGSPCSLRDSQESSPTPQFKSMNSLALSFLHTPTLTSIHDHRKNHSLDQTDLCQQTMSLLFNMLSRLVITFLPRSKHLLISWLPSPSAVIILFLSWSSQVRSVSCVSCILCLPSRALLAIVFSFLFLHFLPTIFFFSQFTNTIPCQISSIDISSK